MKISECAYCGIVGFTKNDACLNCSAPVTPTEQTTKKAPAQNSNMTEPAAPFFLKSTPPSSPQSRHWTTRITSRRTISLNIRASNAGNAKWFITGRKPKSVRNAAARSGFIKKKKSWAWRAIRFSIQAPRGRFWWSCSSLYYSPAAIITRIGRRHLLLYVLRRIRRCKTSVRHVYQNDPRNRLRHLDESRKHHLNDQRTARWFDVYQTVSQNLFRKLEIVLPPRKFLRRQMN